MPDGAAFTAAPFLTVFRDEDGVLVVNGVCHVLVAPSTPPELTVLVHELWSGTRGEGGISKAITRLVSVEDHPSLEQAVVAALPAVVSDTLSHEAQAVLVAKKVAEHGRNSVGDFRQLRYAAERHLANSISDESYDGLSLPALIELGIAAGRSRDIAQRAARSGLWVYRFNDPLYHEHRRMLDPTLAPREGGEVERPDYFRVLDAGVRQCRMMAAYLDDELEQLHRLIQATASISAARDVRAQERFNFVATLGALVIGLPALVLAVYGSRNAGASPWPWVWVVPVAACGVIAWFVAGLLPGDVSARRRHRREALLAAIVTVALVCGAAVVLGLGS